MSLISGSINLPPLLAATGGIPSASPLPPAANLTTAELQPIFAEASRRWEQRGLGRSLTAALHNVTFQIVDLPAGYLGQAALYGTTIFIDVTAEDYGWYVDPTPADDIEFARAALGTRLYTDSTQAPAGRMDLLTTVMHELGHVLGLDSSFDPLDRDDLMYAYLTTGERRLPVLSGVLLDPPAAAPAGRTGSPAAAAGLPPAAPPRTLPAEEWPGWWLSPVDRPRAVRRPASGIAPPAAAPTGPAASPVPSTGRSPGVAPPPADRAPVSPDWWQVPVHLPPSQRLVEFLPVLEPSPADELGTAIPLRRAHR